MRINLSKSTFYKLVISQLAITLIYPLLLQLTISRALAEQSKKQQYSQQGLELVANTKGTESEVAQLIEILEQKFPVNKPPSSIETASQKLVKIGKPAVPQLLNVLNKYNHTDSYAATNIAITLSEIAEKDSSVVKILIDKLGDNNRQVRYGVMTALRYSSSFEAELKQATQDKNPRISSGAILILGSGSYGKEPALLSIFKRALQSKDASIRRSAAISLGLKDDKPSEVIAILKNGLQDKNSLIRVYSASILAKNNSYKASATPVLIESLKHPYSVIRWVGMWGFLDIRPVNPQFLSIMINDKNSFIRYRFIKELSYKANSLDTAVVPTLIKALDDEEEEIRYIAIYTLGNMATSGYYALEAKPKLFEISENKREIERNRNSALSALAEIDSQALIPYLVKKLPDKEMKGISASILSRIASKMKENKNNYSKAELAKAISEFEKGLKIIDETKPKFSQDKIKYLRESIVELKK